MSRKEQEIHSNQSTSQEVTNYTSTGYSNSRLNRHTMYTPEPKLSFDAMTIVGNLNKNNAHKLSEFMSIDPQIRLWDILQTKFKAKALQEKVGSVAKLKLYAHLYKTIKTNIVLTVKSFVSINYFPFFSINIIWFLTLQQNQKYFATRIGSSQQGLVITKAEDGTKERVRFVYYPDDAMLKDLEKIADRKLDEL